MLVKGLTLLGLLLDIVGAILLFKYGLPPDFDPLGRSFIITESENEEEKKKGDHYRFWGKFGLILLIAGFLFQLGGNWLS